MQWGGFRCQVPPWPDLPDGLAQFSVVYGPAGRETVLDSRNGHVLFKYTGAILCRRDGHYAEEEWFVYWYSSLVTTNGDTVQYSGFMG